MSTHAQIKQKAKKAQKKRGGPTPYEQKMKRLLGSVHKVNLESVENLDNKDEIERVIRYRKEELLG